MRPLHYSAVLLLSLSMSLLADDKPKPKKETIFQVEGLECPSCVYMVQQSLTETVGVENVQVDQGFLGGTAKVSYDPKQLSEHQIAQAVREAVPLHGNPYLAVLQVNVSDFAKGGHAEAIKSFFAPSKKWVELIVLDEAKGQLLIRFQPMEADEKGVMPKGWSLEPFTDLLKKRALKYEIVEPRPE